LIILSIVGAAGLYWYGANKDVATIGGCFQGICFDGPPEYFQNTWLYQIGFALAVIFFIAGLTLVIVKRKK